MADSYSDRLGLIGQEEGTHSNEWGDLLNLNFERLDSAIRGYTKITLSGAETLDSNDITATSSVAQEESFFQFIEFTGTGGTVTVPAEDIIWTVYNNTGGDFTFQPSGGTGVTLTDGKVQRIIYGSNGTTFTDVTDLGLFNAALTGAATFGTTLNSVTTAEFATLDGITSSTSELNILTGVTASASELNLLTSRTLASTDDVIDNFPSGTLMTFQQTTAPTGWTKEVTHNDKALRVVSGTASSGGTNAFSTTFDAALATSSDGSHSHITSIPATGWSGGTHANARAYWATSAVNRVNTRNLTSDTEADHNHTFDLDVLYVDLVICSKD